MPNVPIEGASNSARAIGGADKAAITLAPETGREVNGFQRFAPGIMAHKSALRDGELLDIPDWGEPDA